MTLKAVQGIVFGKNSWTLKRMEKVTILVFTRRLKGLRLEIVFKSIRLKLRFNAISIR